jgi:hypothetical protein
MLNAVLVCQQQAVTTYQTARPTATSTHDIPVTHGDTWEHTLTRLQSKT